MRHFDIAGWVISEIFLAARRILSVKQRTVSRRFVYLTKSAGSRAAYFDPSFVISLMPNSA